MTHSNHQLHQSVLANLDHIASIRHQQYAYWTPQPWLHYHLPLLDLITTGAIIHWRLSYDLNSVPPHGGAVCLCIYCFAPLGVPQHWSLACQSGRLSSFELRLSTPAVLRFIKLQLNSQWWGLPLPRVSRLGQMERHRPNQIALAKA